MLKPRRWEICLLHTLAATPTGLRCKYCSAVLVRPIYTRTGSVWTQLAKRWPSTPKEANKTPAKRRRSPPDKVATTMPVSSTFPETSLTECLLTRFPKALRRPWGE